MVSPFSQCNVYCTSDGFIWLDTEYSLCPRFGFAECTRENDREIYYGSSVNLTASAGPYVYTWNPGGSNSQQYICKSTTAARCTS